MKTKIQIKTFGGSLLFEYESEGNTTKETLVEAVKHGAYLQGADLHGADLQGADLHGAYLQGADLQGAYLQGADLQGADLQGADLHGAYLQDADLRDAKGLKLYWHIHHEYLVENLTEPLKNRQDYIKKEKPKEEIALRLKLLKKVKAKQDTWPTTKEGWEELHKKECENCPWNGYTIFPKTKV